MRTITLASVVMMLVSVDALLPGHHAAVKVMNKNAEIGNLTCAQQAEIHLEELCPRYNCGEKPHTVVKRMGGFLFGGGGDFSGFFQIPPVDTAVLDPLREQCKGKSAAECCCPKGDEKESICTGNTLLGLRCPHCLHHD